MRNVNTTTGIPFGVISSNSLNPEVVDQLLYGPQAHTDEEEDYSDEPYAEGVLEGVAYATCWLGGALNFFILKSPHLADAAPCSPCVPGAGNLDEVGHFECYDVPKTWRNHGVL